MTKIRPVLAVLFAVVAGCSTTPNYPSPVSGQTISAVAAAQKSVVLRPVFLLAESDHRLALYGVDEYGALDASGRKSVAVLVFYDDRFVGKINATAALDYAACLSRTNGRSMLAERLLRLAARQPDPFAMGNERFKNVRLESCPSGEQPESIVEPDSVKASEPVGAMDVAGGILGYSAVLIVGLATLPVTLPAAIGMAAYGASEDSPSLQAQEKIDLGQDAEMVEQIMGKPTSIFCLAPTHNEVWYFARVVSPGLWLGFEQGHVVWLKFGSPDKWLSEVTGRVGQNTERCQ